MKFVLPIVLDVHIARVPVAVLRNTLRTPVRPDAELGVAIPLRRFILQQRIPRWLVGAVAFEALNGRIHRHAIPGAAGDGQVWRRAPCSRFPACFIELLLDDLAVDESVKHAVGLRRGTEFVVGLVECIEAGGRLCCCVCCCTWRDGLSCCRNGAGCSSCRNQLAEFSALHGSKLLCKKCERVIERYRFGRRDFEKFSPTWPGWLPLLPLAHNLARRRRG